MARPNVLWIYLEDVSPWMGCYGDGLPQTPVIGRLAEGGVLFTRAFASAPVCATSRSAVITGAMQTTLGTHHHRSARTDDDAIHLPAGVRTVPEIFREAGYHTFNRGKDDYNFTYDRAKLYSDGASPRGFYGMSGEGHWRERRPGQPFFGQLQLAGGKSGKQAKEIDPVKVTLPPYYPDHEVMRGEYAHHYGCIEYTDEVTGGILGELERDGLLEDTAVFFFADHGMRGLRHKQFCYDGGLHVPLIVSWPGGSGRIGAGAAREELVSTIDVAATTLSLAGLEVPGHMESRDLFADEHEPREYVVSARDRCDYTIDRIRTVRTDKFRYIRNFMTDRPWMQPQYRDDTAQTKVMKELYAAGKLDEVQARFMGPERPAEELYDVVADPHQIRNLASDPGHAGELERHRGILDEWIAETDDKGQYPESERGLLAVIKRWGARCVNPEYDEVRGKCPGEIAEACAFDEMERSRSEKGRQG